MAGLRWIVISCVFLASSFASSEEKRENRVKSPEHFEIHPKDDVLAKLLSGNWEENIYYSKGEYQIISHLRFQSNSLAVHLNFTYRIIDPEQCLVEKKLFDFGSRRESTVEVVLDRREFWETVNAVRVYHEKYDSFPASPINFEVLKMAMDSSNENSIKSKITRTPINND